MRVVAARTSQPPLGLLIPFQFLLCATRGGCLAIGLWSYCHHPRRIGNPLHTRRCGRGEEGHLRFTMGSRDFNRQNPQRENPSNRRRQAFREGPAILPVTPPLLHAGKASQLDLGPISAIVGLVSNLSRERQKGRDSAADAMAIFLAGCFSQSRPESGKRVDRNDAPVFQRCGSMPVMLPGRQV